MATKSFPSAPIVTSTNKLYEKAFKTFTFQFKTSFVEGVSRNSVLDNNRRLSKQNTRINDVAELTK